jgi:hypothetical protein
MKVTNTELMKFENQLEKFIEEHKLSKEFHDLGTLLFSLRHRLRLYGYDDEGKF